MSRGDPLSLIEKKESGGKNVPNYKYGPGFSASGNFQMINATWKRWAQKAGVDISKYPTAMSAPYDLQRKVAAQGYKMEGFKPWEAVKGLVGQESSFDAPGSGVLAAQGTAPAPQASTGWNRVDLNPYVAKGRTIEGSNEALKERLGYALGAMPEDVLKSFMVNSGYRTIAEQQKLWDKSDKSGKMVARPGGSQHGKGNAFDIGNGAARDWLHKHGKEYGLNFPMSYEPWHIETAEARGGPAFQGAWGSPSPAAGGVLAANGAPGAAPAAPPVAAAPAAPPGANFLAGLQSVMSPTGTPDAPMETTPMTAMAPAAPQTTEVQGAGDLMAGLLARRRGFGGFA